MENLNLWGHGLGQWRADAQGEVNERIGRCDLFVRHAHSDLLEYVYELGVLPIAILIGIIFYRLRERIMCILVFTPLLLFSFPTERPEIMIALAVSMTTINNKELEPSLYLRKSIRYIQFVSATLVFMGISSWAYSQHLFGKFFSKTADISKLNSCQQIVVSMYPQDILNNSLALYQAHYLITHQEEQSAIHILEERLRTNPQDLGVQKQLIEIKPSAEITSVYCSQIHKP
ncbi:MAG: hypothetical protein ACKOW8_04345 [Flavobacteriales bacterium]